MPGFDLFGYIRNLEMRRQKFGAASANHHQRRTTMYDLTTRTVRIHLSRKDALKWSLYALLRLAKTCFSSNGCGVTISCKMRLPPEPEVIAAKFREFISRELTRVKDEFVWDLQDGMESFLDTLQKQAEQKKKEEAQKVPDHLKAQIEAIINRLKTVVEMERAGERLKAEFPKQYHDFINRMVRSAIDRLKAEE